MSTPATFTVGLVQMRSGFTPAANLDTAVKQVSGARTQAGGAMTVLDQATQARSVMEQDMTEAISKFVEVDTVSAAATPAKCVFEGPTRPVGPNQDRC